MNFKKIKNRIVAACLVATLATLPGVIPANKTQKVFANQNRTTNFNKNYSTTRIGAQDMVNIAMAQVGKTQSQLGYTEAWCANFVCDCAVLAGQSDIIPHESWVPTLKTLVVGSIVTSPEAGDLVIYGDDDHIGIMIDSQRAVEGNCTNHNNANDRICSINDVSYWPSHYFIRPVYHNSTPSPAPVANEKEDPFEKWPYANEYEKMMFDASFYVLKYADLRKKIGNNERALYKHWREFGIAEGRAASIYFDPKYYAENNADIKQKFGTNYKGIHQHFIKVGYNQKKKFSPILDLKFYEDKHSGLQGKSGAELLKHFYKDGSKKGLGGSAEFVPKKYKNRYADLAKAFKDNWIAYYRHYLLHGIKEGRIGN